MSHSSRWLLRRPGPTRPLRLYCFSYAGGQAGIFAPWQAALGSDVEVCGVQLPGRGNRTGEAPITSMPVIVKQIANVVALHKEQPFAFFGHSLGALLAFEVARYCARHEMTLPVHLFVSGCDAPGHRTPMRPLHRLPDAELRVELAAFNGTPPEVLANEELMQLVLPILRADLALACEYEYRRHSPLPIPLTVLAGTRDAYTSRDRVEKWTQESSAHQHIQWFDGDHFFINTHQDAVLECVKAHLAALLNNRGQLFPTFRTRA